MSQYGPESKNRRPYPGVGTGPGPCPGKFSPDFKMSPGSRFPGPGLRDPGDPVPNADP